MDNWYNVTQKDIYMHGGSGILDPYYGGSPSKALQNIYPEHIWNLWKFKKSPTGYWETLEQNIDELKKVIDRLGEQLSVKSLEDWYGISLEQIAKFVNIGSSKELGIMLQKSYPQHCWDLELLSPVGRAVKASQRELLVNVQHLFPTQSIYLIDI